MPVKAIEYCLESAGITMGEVDHVVFHEKIYRRFLRVIEDIIRTFPHSYITFLNIIPEYLGRRLVLPFELKKATGYKGKVLYSSHHLSHAASSFLLSGFDKAAIITADGMGETSSLTTGYGVNNKIYPDNTLDLPASLGLLYNTLTAYTGFRVNSGEGKVMSLSDHAQPLFLKQLEDILDLQEDGSFYPDSAYFDFRSGGRLFTDKFVKTFGMARKNEEELSDHHIVMA